MNFKSEFHTLNLFSILSKDYFLNEKIEKILALHLQAEGRVENLTEIRELDEHLSSSFLEWMVENRFFAQKWTIHNFSNEKAGNSQEVASRQ